MALGVCTHMSFKGVLENMPLSSSLSSEHQSQYLSLAFHVFTYDGLLYASTAILLRLPSDWRRHYINDEYTA